MYVATACNTGSRQRRPAIIPTSRTWQHNKKCKSKCFPLAHLRRQHEARAQRHDRCHDLGYQRLGSGRDAAVGADRRPNELAHLGSAEREARQQQHSDKGKLCGTSSVRPLTQNSFWGGWGLGGWSNKDCISIRDTSTRCRNQNRRLRMHVKTLQVLRANGRANLTRSMTSRAPRPLPRGTRPRCRSAPPVPRPPAAGPAAAPGPRHRWPPAGAARRQTPLAPAAACPPGWGSGSCERKGKVIQLLQVKAVNAGCSCSACCCVPS